MKKVIINTILIFTVIIVICILINLHIKKSTIDNVLEISELKKNKYDCILVLGASIKNNNPSPMLEDRLITSINLYQDEFSNKILVSGDHRQEDYDEVNVMKRYLVEKDIPSKDIFMDHKGISTYDSIYRAKEIYKANKIIIVTQEYHLYRALYIAKKLNVDAIGISTDKIEYNGQELRDLREVAARIKDFFKCIIKPQSKYLGKEYPITGDGDKTNDK